jgi:hypothetical protein
VLTTELELLSGFRSETGETTIALSIKPVHTVFPTLAVSVMFVVPRALMEPKEKTILPPVVEIAAGTAETKLTPEGSEFVTLTDVA